MKQINQTTYHPVSVNKHDVDQIRVTYCKDAKQYLIEQVDRHGRLTNQRGYFIAETHEDMKTIRDLLIGHH